MTSLDVHSSGFNFFFFSVSFPFILMTQRRINTGEPRVEECTTDPPRQWVWNLIWSASSLARQTERKVIACPVLVVVRGNVTPCLWTGPSVCAGASPCDTGEQSERTVSEHGWQKCVCHSFIRDSQRGIEILGFCGDWELHIKCLSGNLITWAWSEWHSGYINKLKH